MDKLKSMYKKEKVHGKKLLGVDKLKSMYKKGKVHGEEY